MTDNWLTNILKRKVRRVFEPKYKRRLTDEEVVLIANNLADFIEAYLKFKSRQKYKTSSVK